MSFWSRERDEAMTPAEVDQVRKAELTRPLSRAIGEAHHDHRAKAPERVGFGVLTMSDSRDLSKDVSGETIAKLASLAGHPVEWRQLVPDEPAEIKRAIAEALGERGVHILVATGGTGVSPRDVTIDTVLPLFERRLPGFGEIFRYLSFNDIGAAAFLSRAEAGVIAGRPVFLLPGSPKACQLAMEKLILPEAAHLVALVRPELRRP